MINKQRSGETWHLKKTWNLEYSKCSGISVCIRSTTTLKANKDLTYKKTKTLAKGNITLTGEIIELAERLNRDIVSLKQEFKPDVTFDIRLLTEDGQKNIKRGRTIAWLLSWFLKICRLNY